MFHRADDTGSESQKMSWVLPDIEAEKDKSGTGKQCVQKQRCTKDSAYTGDDGKNPSDGENMCVRQW